MSYFKHTEETSYVLDAQGNVLHVGRKFVEKRGAEFFVDLVTLEEERNALIIKPGTLVIDFDAADVEPTPVKKDPGTHEPYQKPPVTLVVGCQNQGSRNGSAIKRIILHYTTAREPEGSVAWFLDPDSKVSAHYIVDRKGKVWQVVHDSDKAWHAGADNPDSIGIEHCAAMGDKLTAVQEQTTVALQKWLCAAYNINPFTNITAHRFAPHNIGLTDCPGSLWETESELKAWVKVHFADFKVTPKALVNSLVTAVGKVFK